MNTEHPPRRSAMHEPPTSAARMLHPGDIAVATQGERLETLLGSCVAVVLADRRDTVAAMCHIVHPGRAPARSDKPTAWGHDALREMFSRLTALGVTPQLCEAHVFGGGSFEPATGAEPARVGERNVQWVLARLQELGIHVHQQSVGGRSYRKLAWSVGERDRRLTLQSCDWTNPGTIPS